jgi:hypothetical protein
MTLMEREIRSRRSWGVVEGRGGRRRRRRGRAWRLNGLGGLGARTAAAAAVGERMGLWNVAERSGSCMMGRKSIEVSVAAGREIGKAR